METTIGTCSLCGGPVKVPSYFYGDPIPTCSRCGATKRKPHGAVIDMEPSKGLGKQLDQQLNLNKQLTDKDGGKVNDQDICN